jgi:hypothetical protein
MNRMHIAGTLLVAAALGTSACNRPAEEPTQQSAVDRQRQEQQEEATRLDQRLTELERDWTSVQGQLKSDADAATTAVKAEIQEDLKNARGAVDELKSTTEANWWQRHERVVERTADEVEEDVRRFARRWTPPAAAVGTTGADSAWEARRDQLVKRMDARIEAMERALEDIDLRGAQEREVEDTRARVKKMKEDADRLRNASEDDWWDITKKRVNEYVDRLDASIDRVRENVG